MVSVSQEAAAEAFNRVLLELISDMVENASFPSAVESVEGQKQPLLKLLSEFDPECPTHVGQLVVTKLLNLIVAKAEFLRRRTTLVSRPFGLLADPSNGCGLRCPGCVHSEANGHTFIWPNGLLEEGTLRRFLRDFGPYAFQVGFFNYGEPFLNRQTPLFIQLAREYLLRTILSTNLSMHIDPEAIVTSGLDYMIVSIDGATQETYAKFRRGGRLDLVLSNVEQIVEEKGRQQAGRPYIVWQYLVFEHNQHEMDLAEELAREIGVDAIYFSSPFSVAWDDPSIVVCASHQERRVHFSPFSTSLTEGASANPNADGISASIEESWSARLSGEASATSEVQDTCPWLYKGLVIDALGRVLPCCSAPTTEKNLVFAQIGEDLRDPYNSPMHVLARRAFADERGCAAAIEGIPESDVPYCASCVWDKTGASLSVSGSDLRALLTLEERFAILAPETVDALTDW